MRKLRPWLSLAAVLVLVLIATQVPRHTHVGVAGKTTHVFASMVPDLGGAGGGATGSAAAEGISSAGAENTPPASNGAPANAKRPVNLGIPEGPFDPVLTQEPPPGRSIPPTNHLVNNPAGENVSIVQSEVDVASYGDTLVVGWNDGLGFVVGGVTISGYGYSVDRGETWVDGGSVPSGPNASVYGDPTVAVTNSGRWVFVSLDLGTPQGLAVNRSRFVNGTLTWAPSTKFTDGGQSIDKEFVSYDPATNRLYMAYVVLAGAGTGKLTYSTDEGATWAPPLTVASGSRYNGFYPAYGVDGEVYVTWLEGLASPSGRQVVRYSSNGGQSWASSEVTVVTLGAQSAGAPQCFNRSFNITYPTMAVDRSQGPHRGRAYFCYTNGAPGNFDIYVSYSDNKGQTWSAPLKINDETNVSEQFWPHMQVGSDGRVTVGWYDRRNATNNNSLCDFYITQSVDGGANWGPNRRLSDRSVGWCGVPANISPNFGDYIGLTVDDRSVFGVWSDARGGGPDVYSGRFDDRFLLAVDGTVGHTRTQFAGDGTAWYIPNETDFVSDPAPALDSPAQLLVGAFGLGTLASAKETPGMFQVAGEALHGEVTFVSSLGSVTGTFSVARSGANGINYVFNALSDAGLDGVQALSASRIQTTLIPGGPGLATMHGTASISRLEGPLQFSVDATIHFDGAQGSLTANQSFDENITTQMTPSLHMHTRTTVLDGISVDVPPLSAGSNPPPLATVRAAPNPLAADTKIVYTLTHPASGSIQIYSVEGRSVRTIAKGPFEAGAHDIPFDGNDDSGRKLAMGGYFIRFETDQVKVAGKLLVVK